MEMELEHVSNLPARSVYVGAEEFMASAGQRLTIETSPAGVEVLDAEVPRGKQWAVTVMVNVAENDA